MLHQKKEKDTGLWFNLILYLFFFFFGTNSALRQNSANVQMWQL